MAGEGYGVTGDPAVDGVRKIKLLRASIHKQGRKEGRNRKGEVPMPKGFGLIAPMDKNAYSLPRTKQKPTLSRRKTTDVGTATVVFPRDFKSQVMGHASDRTNKQKVLMASSASRSPRRISLLPIAPLSDCRSTKISGHPQQIREGGKWPKSWQKYPTTKKI